MTKKHKVLCLKNPFKFTKERHCVNKRDGIEKINEKNFQWIESDSISEGDYLVRYCGRTAPVSDINFIDLSKYAEKFDNTYVYETHVLNTKHPLSIKTICKETKLSQNYLLSLRKNRKVSFRKTKNLDRLTNYLSKNGFNFSDFLNYRHEIIKKYPRYLNVDKDFCYVLGFFIGDGWCPSSSEKSSIGFAFHSEENTLELEKITNFFKKNDASLCERKSKKRKLTQLIVNSKIFKKLFFDLVPGKTLHKSIPDSFMFLPDEKLYSIFRGLMESDGSETTRDGRKSFDSISLKLIYQVFNLFEYFGYTCRISRRNQKKCHESYKIQTRGNITKQSHYGSFRIGNYILVRVEDKKYVKSSDGKVYDLSVKDDPSYSTTNFIVHNSSGGSLILYLLGVTNVDPIKHELIFERFISADRVETVEKDGKKYYLSLPDVDLDISAIGRVKVIEYLKEKYSGRFSKIATINTLDTKSCIKNAGKIVSNYSEQDMNEITPLVEVMFGKSPSIEDTIKNSEKFRKWAENNKKCVTIAEKLRGIIVASGVHASGYVISGKNLEDFIPTHIDKNDELVSSYEMKTIESLAIKVDLLSLKTLDVISLTLKELGIKYRDFFNDPSIIGFDINNPDIYKIFQDLKYPKGIFQLESGTANKATRTVKPKSIEEVSDVTSLARPGSLQFIGDYSKVKFGELELQKHHPILDEILAPSKGYIVYQEQIMFILHRLYRFSLKDANSLRKAIGKKIREKVDAWKDKIYQKGEELKIDKEVTDFYWKAVTAAADYSFCKSHATAYSYLSVVTAFLKYKYPKEFFFALLQMSKYEQNPFAEVAEIVKELPYFNIKLLPPDIIKSDMEFKLEGNDIRCGLFNIKGISDKSLEALKVFRDKDYPSKFEMFIAAKNAGINIGAFSALIQAGALSNVDVANNRPKLVLEAQSWNLLTEREMRNVLRISNESKNYDLLKIVMDCVENKAKGDDNKIIISEKRFETFKKKYAPYKEIYLRNKKYPQFCNYFYEKRLLGFNYSVTLLDCFPKDTDLKDTRYFEGMTEREKVTIVGTVFDVYKGKAKSSGKEYCRILIEDEYGKLTFLMAGKTIQKWDFNSKPLPEIGDIVYCSGSKYNDALMLDYYENFDEKIYLKLSELK